MRVRKRHFFPVPLNPLGIVLIIVKEVNLLRSFDHCGVKVQHLQQCSGASFPHPNDNGLGKLLNQVVQPYLLLGGIALSELVEQPSLELQSSQLDFVLAAGSKSTIDGAEGLQSASKIRGIGKKKRYLLRQVFCIRQSCSWKPFTMWCDARIFQLVFHSASD